MTPHRAVVAAGPRVIRRLCCAPSENSDVWAAALEAIDDPVALVGERPVGLDALWCAVLSSLAEGHRGVLVVHPSWWSASRVDLVTAAARATAGDQAAVRPRSWLLTQPHAAVLVEIAERLVAISGRSAERGSAEHRIVAVPRRTEEQAVAEEVARVIAAMTQGSVLIDTVLIDPPSAVSGARRIAKLIADAIPTGHIVTTVDDAAVNLLARAAAPIPDDQPAPGPRTSSRTRARLAVAGVAVTAGLAVPAMSVEEPHPATRVEPTTVLVEGDVALTIPAAWLTQRVIAGPGSARVQVTSPSDPEAALHVTQTPTPGETLAGTAERLRRAIDAEPAGVFVDFNASGVSAGRPAVTYREVRSAHDVRWTVLLDGSVRISIGCQSRPAAQDAVRDACERAVRTAHAVG